MRSNRLKGLTGILLMALAVGAMYFWLTYGTEVLATKAVLVAVEDIAEGTVIDVGKHFIVDNRSLDSLISDGLTKNDIKRLSGMAANQYIPKNAQIDIKFFSNADLVITEEKAVFKVPSSWIYAVPSSIRRGDKVQFLEVDSRLGNTMNAQIRDSQGGIATYSGNAIIIGQTEPVLSSTIIYVKDSTNREVNDADQRPRMDGTSQVSSVEIVCTNADIKVLEKSIANGMQFIIIYN